MRFIKNLYRSALAVVAGALVLTSCQPEESPLSRAILTSVSAMQFAAQNAEPQTITVYADAEWTVEAPEWVTVDKTAGNRTMEVTISVGDNMRDGAIDNPKKDTIVFRGYNLLAHAYVIVMQEGDKYRDVPATTVSGILGMKDEDVVILEAAQVVAVSSKGFVVSDGSANVFVVSTETVAVGDEVNVMGSKGTVYGLPAVSICDNVEVVGNSAVVYPTSTDITASVDTYASSTMEYVELTGSLEGSNVLVEGAVKVGSILDAASALDLSALNGHNVTVKGYSAGVTASLVNIIGVEIVDLGVNEIIYFADNFDWLAELAESCGAGDSMGVDGDDSAKNAYTSVSGFADLLAAQGYEDLFPSSKTIYLQRNYLKFSKNKNVNGLRLPAITCGGTTNVVMTFDWGIHVGSGGQDDVELAIEIEGNGVVSQETFTHTAGEWTWQTETVTISGIDDDSRIVIKPVDFTGAATSTDLYRRWYLDNIKIVDAGGAVVPPAGDKVYFEETWDWVAPWADAYGSSDSVGDNDHSGKAPNVYTQETQAGFMDEFTARGYVDLNPDGKVMYTQKYYMKFGKTNVHTGITLPANDFEGDTPVDVDITFNWCAHMITKEPYTFDKVQMVVEISGPGVCADSNGQVSNAYASNQKDGQMEWQDFSVRLNGVTKDTRISIRPLDWKKTGTDGDQYKVQRYHLDNIKIQKAK